MRSWWTLRNRPNGLHALNTGKCNSSVSAAIAQDLVRVVLKSDQNSSDAERESLILVMTSECPVSGHVFGAKDYTEIKQAMLVLKLVGFEIVSHQQLLFIARIWRHKAFIIA